MKTKMTMEKAQELLIAAGICNADGSLKDDEKSYKQTAGEKAVDRAIYEILNKYGPPMQNRL